MNNKILIVHHTDADGHCAAAIVRYELTNPTNVVMYHSYDYNGEINYMIDNDSTIYLVDISMNEFVEKFIKKRLECGCKVIHIDHHKTSVEYYNTHDDYKNYDNWIHFTQDENDTRNGPISGALLTYMYTCMKPEQRLNPMSVEFDLTELRDHFIFNNNMENQYRVPYIVRLIDDHDVWLHKLNESKPFAYAYYKMPYELTNPEEDDLWECIYNDNSRLLFQSIKDGVRYIEEEAISNKALRILGGFDSDVFGVPCYCLNNLKSGSDQFGEKYEHYPLVCRFAYNGKDWVYSLYSNNKVDCSEIAKRYGGGGHKGAAGFTIDYSIFGNKDQKKKTFWEKLKDLFKK